MGKKHASQYANFGWLRIIFFYVEEIDNCSFINFVGVFPLSYLKSSILINSRSRVLLEVIIISGNQLLVVRI